MRLLLILSALLLVGCGQTFPSKGEYHIDIAADFQPYVDMFIDLKGNGLSYPTAIRFAELNGNTVGLCTRWSNGQRLIQVDKDYWNSQLTSEDERISLIFHELGHCDLNRDHVSSLRQDGWPDSLMYPYNTGYPQSLENYYFDELFSQSSVGISSKTSNCVHDLE